MESARKQWAYYKRLAEKAIDQLTGEQLFVSPGPESNSIAVIVQHMAGNMLSRFTDFLTTDGEKPWRDRDREFESRFDSKEALLAYWEQGWACLETACAPLTVADLQRIVYIRNEGHTVMEALNRQLSHYPYHVGQIVYIAKILTGPNWESLSIPKGGSDAYNAAKFEEGPSRKHFTDDGL